MIMQNKERCLLTRARFAPFFSVFPSNQPFLLHRPFGPRATWGIPPIRWECTIWPQENALSFFKSSTEELNRRIGIALRRTKQWSKDALNSCHLHFCFLTERVGTSLPVKTWVSIEEGTVSDLEVTHLPQKPTFYSFLGGLSSASSVHWPSPWAACLNKLVAYSMKILPQWSRCCSSTSGLAASVDEIGK